jgi:uncharacterized 2Fe-2S/4Fe-4S cluster protein (DUF4445 family)
MPLRIRFLPEGRVHEAAAPVELYVAAAAAGILIEQPCGSLGTCGRCRVRVVEGATPPGPADLDLLSADDLEAGWRLGCQLVLDRSCAIEIPAVLRSPAGKSFGDDLPSSALGRPVVVARTATESGPGTAGSRLDDLADALGRPHRALQATPCALVQLSMPPEGAATRSAILDGDEVVAVRVAPASGVLGLAVDIGSTSLAAALVRLSDGAVVASASALNPQVAYGADVIARIRHAMDHPEGIAHLRDAVRAGLAGLVTQLTGEVGCDGEDVVTAAVAGNPTMLHAWLGIPVDSLGRAPYAGAWVHAMVLKAAEAGLPVHANANVRAFPMVRSHVGADAMAASIACDLDRQGTGARALIDLGTNTEVIVVSGGRVVATSAAAGPAFEGVSITHGMRAAPGAIELVSVAPDGDLRVHTIAGREAAGLCGSGLIDAVAVLLRAGAIDPSGYLRKAAELPPTASARLAARVIQVDRVQAVVLARADESQDGDPIVLTARDVREVQLAKGSILAAVTLACRHLGVAPEDLGEVLVAGAFGNHIRKTSAIRIGIVPRVDPERIRFVGNAAGVGARLALVDRDVLARADAFARRAEYLELATDPAYQPTFLAALAFPDAA